MEAGERDVSHQRRLTGITDRQAKVNTSEDGFPSRRTGSSQRDHRCVNWPRERMDSA